MPDPVTFRSTALNAAYRNAETQLASLPETDRNARLQTIETRFRALDTGRDVPESQIRLQAEQIVSDVRAGGAARPTPSVPVGVDARTTRISTAVTVAPNVQIDAQSGLPLIDGKAPTSWAELGTAMYGLARAIDGTSEGNVLSGLSVAQRKLVLDQIEKVFAGSSFYGSPIEILGDDVSAQLRASAAAVLHDVVGSTLGDDSRAAGQLLQSALNIGVTAAKAEPHRGVRDSMVFGLYRFQTDLPAELRPITRELMREVAPLRPAYDKWLADGKISADFVVDGDWINVRSMESNLRRMGFTRVEGSNPPVMRQTLGRGEKQALVEITLRTNRTSMFDNVGNENVDIIYYMGHSNYGRAIPGNLPRSPEATGENQLLMFGTCFGKDNMQHVRQRFPEAEIMATFNSAYQNEAFRGVRALWDGIAGRKSWAAISRRIGGPKRGNWLTPTEVMSRRRILDRDNDGRADLLDRLFDVDLQSVDSSMRQGFTPKTQDRPPHELQSLYGVIAANWLNRGVGGYNASVRGVNEDSRVMCAGFFAGKDGDAPVKFEAIIKDNRVDGWKMTINDQYAHMPEEALRAVAAMEFNRFLGQNDERFDFYGDPLKTRVNGLMSVAFTLSHDLYYNDSTVWKDTLRAYGLPTDLSRRDIDHAAHEYARGDDDAGSPRAVEAYIALLRETNPELLEILSAEDAGTWRLP